MPDSWPIALAIIVAVVAAWDWARKDLALAHGRMLSADRSHTFERAITQLETRVKGLATNVDAFDVCDFGGQLNDLQTQFSNLRETAANAATVNDALRTVDERFHGLHDWQKTCERSIELAQEETQKQAKGLVNLALDIETMKNQQAMALQGIAKLPKQGFGGPR